MLYSQEIKFETIDSLPYKSVGDLEAVVNNNGNTLVYYYSDEKMHFIVFDKSGKILHELETNKKYGPVIGISHIDNHFYIYTERLKIGNRVSINCIDLELINGEYKVIEKIVIINDADEKLVSKFQTNNKLYFISIVYNSEKLKIHVVSDSGSVETQEFEEIIPKTYAHFNKAEFEFINPQDRHYKYHCESTEKIYYFDGKLNIVFDNFFYLKDQRSNKTEILTIDLNNYSTKLRSYEDASYINSEKHNSYIFDTLLFRYRYSGKAFNLSILGFNSLQPLKEFNFEKKQLITIIDSTIIRVKATPNKKNNYLDKELKKQRVSSGYWNTAENSIRYYFDTEKLIKGINFLGKNKPSLYVERINDSTAKIFVGSYIYIKPMIHSTGTGPQTVSTPGGNVTVPGHSTTVSRKASVSFVYFESTISLDDFSKRESLKESYKPVDRFFAKMNEQKIKIANSTAFSHSGNTYIAYIVKKEKSIKIEKLE